MDNSYFLTCTEIPGLVVNRFHICNWEFQNGDTLIEFGCEINSSSLKGNRSLELNLHLPWLTEGCESEDFYQRLKDSNNSRFIFNDPVNSTKYFDGGQQESGVLHKFANRSDLCVLPVSISHDTARSVVKLRLNLEPCSDEISDGTNVYFRFGITPKEHISTRKGMLSKSTIIYDIKLNELRSLPIEIKPNSVCKVEKCFCFNILPSSYDLVFFDNTSLKNVRTLEHEAFSKYLGNRTISKDELIAVFNKRSQQESHSFFSVFSKERIGVTQLTIALLINLLSGILLFIPSYRSSVEIFSIWAMPVEFYIIIFLWVISIPFLIYYRRLANRFNWL